MGTQETPERKRERLHRDFQQKWNEALFKDMSRLFRWTPRPSSSNILTQLKKKVTPYPDAVQGSDFHTDTGSKDPRKLKIANHFINQYNKTLSLQQRLARLRSSDAGHFPSPLRSRAPVSDRRGGGKRRASRRSDTDLVLSLQSTDHGRSGSGGGFAYAAGYEPALSPSPSRDRGRSFIPLQQPSTTLKYAGTPSPKPSRRGSGHRKIHHTTDEGLLGRSGQKPSSAPLSLQQRFAILKDERFNIPIYGIRFQGAGRFGDFDWMCRQKPYKRSLFLFNDNEEQHHTAVPGGGNAIIRKYNRHSDLDIPLAAGIPTGTRKKGGYTTLDARTRQTIDAAFQEIRTLLRTHHYEAIYYSVNDQNQLGTSIFNVNPKVLKYIEIKIRRLSIFPIDISSK